jgi:hypothetical protein
LLTGQHTDLYTTRAPEKAAVNGVLSIIRSCRNSQDAE